MSSALTRKRRAMSRSSGLSSSASAGASGSSAIPQIGQLAGSVAHDLGVHRAGEAGRCRLRPAAVGRAGGRPQPALGLGAEALEAAVAAEAVADAGVLEPARALPGDRHPAHGIARARRGRPRRRRAGLQSPWSAAQDRFARTRRRVTHCMTAQGTRSGLPRWISCGAARRRAAGCGGRPTRAPRAAPPRSRRASPPRRA